MKKFLPRFSVFRFLRIPSAEPTSSDRYSRCDAHRWDREASVGNVTILIEGERIRYVGPSGVDVRERASTMGVYRPLLSVACC